MTLCSNMTGTIEILLVEDNPGDVELTRLAFEESALLINLSIARDGVEAMRFVQQRHAEKLAQPDLVLLDLNLPKKNGQEVLSELKINDDFRRIPVIVLTTSQSEEDIVRAYNSYASGYITKPVSFDQFIKVIQSIENFWFTVVRLPPKS